MMEDHHDLWNSLIIRRPQQFSQTPHSSNNYTSLPHNLSQTNNV